MAKKKRVETIDLEKSSRINPAEAYIMDLLQQYIEFNGSELKISPATPRQDCFHEWEYGVSCLSGASMELLSPPTNSIAHEIFSYIRKKTELGEEQLEKARLNYQNETLVVGYKNQAYQIPFSIRFNEHYHKEEITFGTPKKLEQRV